MVGVCVCVCVCVEGRSPTHLPWRRGTRCRCEPRQLINDRTLRRCLHSNPLDVDVVGAGVARLSWKRQSPTPPPGLPSLATIHCANPSRCRRLFFFHPFIRSFIHSLPVGRGSLGESFLGKHVDWRTHWQSKSNGFNSLSRII